jgi:RNA 2',3'-cyclic 3'-phosphodiesterase
MPRIFIAIKTPPALQPALEEVRASFQPLSIDFRWVLPSHLHATLKFLGDVPEAKLDAVFSALTSATAAQLPFVLKAKTLGCFPTPIRPRVLWMGLDDPHHGLDNVYQKLEAALTDVGFPAEERPFHPHLTLARIRRSTSCPPFSALLSTYKTRCFGAIEVDRIEVFQSQLQPTGAIYTVLYTALL